MRDATTVSVAPTISTSARMLRVTIMYFLLIAPLKDDPDEFPNHVRHGAIAASTIEFEFIVLFVCYYDSN